MRPTAVCFALLAACATGGATDLTADASKHPPVDGGRIDVDGGSRDANAIFMDATAIDSGATPYDADTNPSDSGSSDSGAIDAGRSDAGGCGCESGCRAVHRSVSSTGAHLYTTDRAEASRLPWTLEVENYFFLHEAGGPGRSELHRCLLRPGFYFYTQDPNCEGAAGAVHQGVLGWMASSPLCGATPLYRLYAEREGHFYTVYASERDSAVAHGFTYESVSGYVWIR